MQSRAKIQMMIGAGTCTTRLKGPTTLETKTLSNTCAKLVQRPFLSWITWGCHFLEKKMEEFISDPSAVSPRILEKVAKQHAPAQPLTEPGMHCFMRSIRVTSKRDLYSSPSGSR